ncbi:MAG: hypothetical protein AAF916_02300 [Planctomycetota bacterium]
MSLEPFDRIHYGSEDFDWSAPNDPPATHCTRWGTGVLGPLLIIGYAMYGWSAGTMWVPSQTNTGRLRGAWIDGPSMYFAIGVLLSLALFLHAWAFWGQRYCVDHPAVKLPMMLAMSTGVGCAGAWSVHWMVNG